MSESGFQPITLTNFAEGSIEKQFNDGLKQVMESYSKRPKAWKKPRKLTIEIVFSAGDERAADLGVAVSSNVKIPGEPARAGFIKRNPQTGEALEPLTTGDLFVPPIPLKGTSNE